jgi:hypothetical protein
LTDAQDEGRKLSVQDAIEPRSTLTPWYMSFLISDLGFHGLYGYSGAGVANKIADDTGGRVIERTGSSGVVERDGTDLLPQFAFLKGNSPTVIGD